MMLCVLPVNPADPPPTPRETRWGKWWSFLSTPWKLLVGAAVLISIFAAAYGDMQKLWVAIWPKDQPKEVVVSPKGEDWQYQSAVPVPEPELTVEVETVPAPLPKTPPIHDAFEAGHLVAPLRERERSAILDFEVDGEPIDIAAIESPFKIGTDGLDYLPDALCWSPGEHLLMLRVLSTDGSAKDYSSRINAEWHIDTPAMWRRALARGFQDQLNGVARLDERFDALVLEPERNDDSNPTQVVLRGMDNTPVGLEIGIAFTCLEDNGAGLQVSLPLGLSFLVYETTEANVTIKIHDRWIAHDGGQTYKYRRAIQIPLERPADDFAVERVWFLVYRNDVEVRVGPQHEKRLLATVPLPTLEKPGPGYGHISIRSYGSVFAVHELHVRGLSEEELSAFTFADQ